MKSVFTSKTDLAQAYFPYIDPAPARHKLMQLINDDPQLTERLLRSGYRRNGHTFSPNQVATIIEQLGNPFK